MQKSDEFSQKTMAIHISMSPCDVFILFYFLFFTDIYKYGWFEKRKVFKQSAISRTHVGDCPSILKINQLLGSLFVNRWELSLRGSLTALKKFENLSKIDCYI